MADRQSTWRTRRLDLGLSLREVSRRSGVNRGTLSRIERGWPAGPEDAARLVRVFEAAEQEGAS